LPRIGSLSKGLVPAEVSALDGLDRFEARKRIVAWFEENGLLQKIEPNTHAVPHGDRSGVVIEPWLTEQWYVDVKPLAEKAMAAVRSGETKMHPPERAKIFFNWLENIEPWCISRQLWWGHQIPAWYGPKKFEGALSAVERQVFVALTQADALEQARAYYGMAVTIDEAITSPLELENRVLTGSILPVPLYRDPDVLDTWFSSALWPYSTLGWPAKTPELAKFYPNNVLITGFDIIFFWVARMMMTGLHFMEDVPFRDVVIHGLVRDEKGKKMSKTTGNVIDPLSVIDHYGADALRFTLAAMTAQGRDVKLAMNRVEGYRNFATKLWNAARFAEMNGCARVAGFEPGKVSLSLNRWVLGEAAKTLAELEAALESYRYNDACAAAYRFVWGVFCDWYLELAKPVLTGEDGAAKQETRATTAYVIDTACAMLHPFMPFITEELWALTGREGPARANLLALGPWPDLTACRDGAAAEAEIGFVVDLISQIRSVRTEVNVPAAQQIPLVLVAASAETRAVVEAWHPMIERLARLSGIGFEASAPAQSAQCVVRGTVAALPLAGIIDIEAEKQRLRKETDKIVQEIAKIDAKMSNPDFVARAPEEIVEENRERRVDFVTRMARLGEALERLQ
jgi:valyl-tRNA synthetase